MDVIEYTKQKLEKSAQRSEVFWQGIKSRFSNELIEHDEKTRVVDIQDISDDCVDLIMLRKSDNIELEQLEHWRFSIEKRWFKKPIIKMQITSGPFANEFFNEK